MKRFRFVIFSVITLGFLPLNATYKMGSSDPVRVHKKSSASKMDSSDFSSTHKTDPEKDALKNISEKFGISVDRLHYYRQLHYGYEELVPALVIARDAQVEEGRVLKMKTDGMPWKGIVDYFSLNFENFNKETNDVLSPLRKTLSKTALTETPKNREGSKKHAE